MKTRLKMPELLISFVIFISCTNNCLHDNELKRKIEARVISTGKGNEKPVIVLAELTSFDWDEMFVVVPYVILTEEYRQKGIDISCIEKTGIFRRDDITVLVFVRDKKIIKYVEYPRRHGDFSTIDPQKILKKEAAVFNAIAIRDTLAGGRLFYKMAEASR